MSRRGVAALGLAAVVGLAGLGAVLAVSRIVKASAAREASAAAQRYSAVVADLVDDVASERAELLTEIEIRGARELQIEARALAALAGSTESELESWQGPRRSAQLEEARQRARILSALEASRDRDRAAASLASAQRAEEEAAGESSASVVIGVAAILGAGIGLVLVGSWLFHRRLVTQPLQEVRRSIEAVDAGLETRTVPEGTPAVRGVAQAFNALVDGFGSSRRSLEQQVDLKTRALAEALEEQRAQSQRLERVLEELRSAQDRLVRQERMAALGTLAGGVAHEFNNILGGIKGCTEGVRSEVDDPELGESLEVVLRAAGRGRRIVEGLLRFSQGSARAPRRIEIGPVIDDVVALMESEAAARKVRIEIGRLDSAFALADPVEIHQVFDNLLRNAVQASPPGGAVGIDLVAHEDRIAVEIRDAGPGIAPEVAARLFEPFFTTREREGGTGLGLAISHGIIAALGGSLSHRAAPEGGTIFEVVLPGPDS